MAKNIYKMGFGQNKNDFCQIFCKNCDFCFWPKTSPKISICPKFGQNTDTQFFFAPIFTKKARWHFFGQNFLQKTMQIIFWPKFTTKISFWQKCATKLDVDFFCPKFLPKNSILAKIYHKNIVLVQIYPEIFVCYIICKPSLFCYINTYNSRCPFVRPQSITEPFVEKCNNSEIVINFNICITMTHEISERNFFRKDKSLTIESDLKFYVTWTLENL